MLLILSLLFLVTLSYVGVKLVIQYAHKLDLYDVPNERSHHCNVTPSGAGLGFVSALLIAFLLFHFQLFFEYWYIFLTILIVFLTGVWDDKNDVSAKTKFIFIFFATFVLYFNGVSIDTLGMWFNHEVLIPTWLAVLLSLLFVGGMTNGVNLIDGIDGLAASVSLVILFFFCIIGLEYHSDIIFTLASFTMAALVGFLFFNWNPAKIFMGDSGSLTLGFIISVLSLLSIEYVNPMALLYVVALPVIDTFIVMVRRIRNGKSPFKPDKTHMHHILVKFFDNRVKMTVLFLAVLQMIYGGIGYALIELASKGLSLIHI